LYWLTNILHNIICLPSKRNCLYCYCLQMLICTVYRKLWWWVWEVWWSTSCIYLFMPVKAVLLCSLHFGTFKIQNWS
jgi:hypothetical protein